MGGVFLAWFGPSDPLVHRKFWSPLSEESLNLMGVSSSRIILPPIHKARGLTECFDQQENDIRKIIYYGLHSYQISNQFNTKILPKQQCSPTPS